MKTVRSRFAPLVVLCFTICEIIPCRAAEDALERQFADGSRLSVRIQEKHFGPDSPEAKTLAQTARASLSKQLGAEQAAKLSIPVFLGWTSLVASVQSPDHSSWTAAWTNEILKMAKADSRLSMSTPLDSIKTGEAIFFAYKAGPIVYVEQIIGRPETQARTRFHLARDSSSGVFWTNAVFIVETNGSISLTARGTRNATLTWELQNAEWLLDFHRSGPDVEREKADREWCLVAYEGDHWIVKRKHAR